MLHKNTLFNNDGTKQILWYFNTLGLALVPGLWLELVLVLPLGTGLRLELILVPKNGTKPHKTNVKNHILSNMTTNWGTFYKQQ